MQKRIIFSICSLALTLLSCPTVPPANAEEGFINLKSPTTANLYSVFMVGTDNGWAVGSGGTIIHWDGSSWNIVTSPTTKVLSSVFMYSANNGWAVGSGGTIIHWDGSSWSNVASPIIANLESVFMVSASDGWAVGQGIIHWDGSSWNIVTDPTTESLVSVFMVGANDGWAVGNYGAIIHWDGSSWSKVTSPASGLRSVFMTNTDYGWAVGDGGKIIHWDGSSWTDAFSRTTKTLYSVFIDVFPGLHPPGGWAVGEEGTILHWDTSGWNLATSPTTQPLYSVFMASSNDAWAVGYGGTIIRYVPPDWVTPFSVTIEAYDPFGGVWSQIAEPITMDGASTGFSTPHTFTGLYGPHTFGVPNTDVYGYPFERFGCCDPRNPVTVDGRTPDTNPTGIYRAVYMYPLTVSLTPTSWTMDIGQSKLFEATASGGTTSTTAYWWHVDNKYQGDVSSPTLVYVPSSAGPHTIDVSAYNPITFPDGWIHIYSDKVVATITVNSVLSTPSVSASHSTVNQGESSTLSVTDLSGGTPPYSYQWLQKAPGAGSYSAITGATSSTYVFSTSSSTATGAWSFEVQVTDSASLPMTVTSSGAAGVVQVVVPEKLLGTDVNNDGIVNIIDVTLVCVAYTSTPEAPNWNANCDVSKDGIVNIVDVGMICSNFGKKLGDEVYFSARR